ncbi:MAG: hypothetical protein COY68_04330 [Candidatus Levybacteria bacterium CG_4_10_14_0_8_um_filter_35_23]|nr:MAG: hypothetical protein COY68_04330 [Candidatus Levybacteria bacterium CG_4_10_14_0_8_um_filter_35_23]
MHSFLKNNFGDKEKILKILVYFVLFLFLIFPYNDKDWGWHFRYGEYLLKTGKILTSDIFSWTLPGYQWVNHSWLYDPILYTLYNYSGFIGLSLIGSLIFLLAFFLTVRGHGLSSWKLGALAF